MANFTWARTIESTLSWSANHVLLASIPQANTLRTIRFSWGFSGYTSQTANIQNATQNIQVLGLVTTVGNGTETPPNPRTAPGNAAPPTERWLWWEPRAPQLLTYSDTADAVWYRDTPLGEPTVMQAMVSAAGIPAGDTLNVWASWAPGSSWDSSGGALLWVGASIGYTASA